MVFEDRVLERIFGLKMDEMAEGGEDSIKRSCVLCALRHI
jgi:hypothetical protein